MELVKLGARYKELENNQRLVVLPCPLGSMVYQVVPDCARCRKAPAPEYCRESKKNCRKKVLPCLFTADLLQDYGKTVFGTEPEAIVASVS